MESKGKQWKSIGEGKEGKKEQNQGKTEVLMKDTLWAQL